MLTFTFNGDGVKTCKCCEKKMSSKGGMYEGVCSSTCSSLQLEYNSIPINLLFLKRLYTHINDEQTSSYNPPFEDIFFSQHLQVFTPSPLNVNANKFSSFAKSF